MAGTITEYSSGLTASAGLRGAALGPDNNVWFTEYSQNKVCKVTSGGTISVICAHLLGLNDAQAFSINWTLANVGITKIQAGRDGLHLLSVNEHAHVEGAQPPLLTYR